MAQSRQPSIPHNAPAKPDNPILRHMAWGPMWVENSNVVFTIVGDPGDGKSWASLRLGEMIYPDFSIDHVAFDIVEFMQKVVDDSYGQGEPIVLEEGSVEASAYDWHSSSNDVFRKVLDTWRTQNRMAIINLPNFKSLEKGARRRTDAIVEMQEAKPWKGYSQAKFKKVRYNNISDNFTTPFPILEGVRRKWIRFSEPSDDLKEAYEQKKGEYTQELNQELLNQLLQEKEEEEQKTRTPKDIANEIIDKGDVDKYLKDNHGMEYIDRDMIELDYDIGDRVSSKVKKVIVEKEDLDVM
jgi:hypothetical protein